MHVDMHAFLAAVTKDTSRYLQRFLPALGSNWWETSVVSALTPQQLKFAARDSVSTLEALDLASLLRVLDYSWHVIRDAEGLTQEDRTYVREMMAIRNRWAHAGSTPISLDDTLRDVDTTSRFCRLIGADFGLIEALRTAKQSLISR